MSSAWRDVIYKGNDNYYLDGDVDAAARCPRAGGTFGKVTYGERRHWRSEHLDPSGGDLRRRDAAPVCQRGAGRPAWRYTGSIATSTNPLQIGGDSIYGQYFQGLIDEVRVYNRALSQAEIQADMNTAVAPVAVDTTPPSAPLSADGDGCQQRPDQSRLGLRPRTMSE